jgi:hypothetical protein
MQELGVYSMKCSLHGMPAFTLCSQLFGAMLWLNREAAGIYTMFFNRMAVLC